MTKQDESKTIEVFAKAFREVVLPVLEDMDEKMATKEDIDRLERKFDVQQNRLDRHGKVIEKHEKEIADLKKVVVN